MDRDVYFLATTAEEMGLLGAEAFADSPPLPLSQIVAAFNLDRSPLPLPERRWAWWGRG
jgi:Zn-dependent M28 family amino/carboxypeptidase